MAVNFPQSPSEGDSFISPAGTIYVYQDSKWVSAAVNPNYADIQGATGADGIQGATGDDGVEGPQGATGADSIVPGPDGIQGATGVGGIQGATGADGNNAIGQVQSSTYVNPISILNAGANTWTDTTITASITPTSSSSKILVIGNMNISAPQGDYVFLRLVRGSTPIGSGNGSGSRPGCFAAYVNNGNDGTAIGANMEAIPFNYVDSPSTTSTVTYKVQFNQINSADDLYINRSLSDVNGNKYGRGSSTITLIEIF